MYSTKIGPLGFGFLICFCAITAQASPFTTGFIRTTCPSPSTAGAYANTDVTCATGNASAWLQFSDFMSTASGSDLKMQALANSINQGFYYPTNVGGQMTFQVGFNVQAMNEFADGLIFHVTSSAPAREQASVTMNVCVGQVMGCAAADMMSLTLDSTSYPIQTINFAPASVLGIRFTGNVDPSAFLSQFEVGVMTGDIPEPSTCLTMGVGLLGLGVARFRKPR
jgi:hypothetical protein